MFLWGSCAWTRACANYGWGSKVSIQSYYGEKIRASLLTTFFLNEAFISKKRQKSLFSPFWRSSLHFLPSKPVANDRAQNFVTKNGQICPKNVKIRPKSTIFVKFWSFSWRHILAGRPPKRSIFRFLDSPWSLLSIEWSYMSVRSKLEIWKNSAQKHIFGLLIKIRRHVFFISNSEKWFSWNKFYLGHVWTSNRWFLIRNRARKPILTIRSPRNEQIALNFDF